LNRLSNISQPLNPYATAFFGEYDVVEGYAAFADVFRCHDYDLAALN
jgi:hypothetical protein